MPTQAIEQIIAPPPVPDIDPQPGFIGREYRFNRFGSRRGSLGEDFESKEGFPE
jgi:hypothetical protein